MQLFIKYALDWYIVCSDVNVDTDHSATYKRRLLFCGERGKLRSEVTAVAYQTARWYLKANIKLQKSSYIMKTTIVEHMVSGFFFRYGFVHYFCRIFL